MTKVKRFLDVGAAILASFRPKSKKLEIGSHGQSSVGLKSEEIQQIMEWLFASLMNAGYMGKTHLIWDNDQDCTRAPVQ